MASNVRIIRLPCTGRIDPLFIIKAFERGADGVIVSGCHPADCHYTSGNYHARRRFAVFHDFMEFIGVDPRRMTFQLGLGQRGRQVARRGQRGGQRTCASSGRSTPIGRWPRRPAGGRRRRSTPRLAATPGGGRGRMNELRDLARQLLTDGTVRVDHRLGGRPPRRPPGLRHRPGRRRQAHLRHALRAQPRRPT